jgi:hypothetical protein
MATDRTSTNPQQATASPSVTTTVECGYCSATVPVNSSSGEVREHKRPLAGRRVRCLGSKQPAYIYPGNLLEGDAIGFGHHSRCIVAARPTVPADSNVWTVPLSTGGNLLRLPGDTLLRLWTRQAGER